MLVDVDLSSVQILLIGRAEFARWSEGVENGVSLEVRVAVRLCEVASNSEGEMSREILRKTF